MLYENTLFCHLLCLVGLYAAISVEFSVQFSVLLLLHIV